MSTTVLSCDLGEVGGVEFGDVKSHFLLHWGTILFENFFVLNLGDLWCSFPCSVLDLSLSLDWSFFFVSFPCGWLDKTGQRLHLLGKCLILSDPGRN